LKKLFILYFIYLLTKFITKAIFESQHHGLINRKKNIYSNYFSLPNFELLYTNGTKGPITVNRKKDDGNKFNIYNMITENNNEDFESFFYDKDEFNKLSKKVSKDEEYLCELGLPSESTEGYYLICPAQYTIAIDKAFYGRYANDKSHCNVDDKGKKVEESRLEVSEDCGKDSIDIVKGLCEGRIECNIRPNISFFSNSCDKDIYKYLHVKYHCIKNKELKKTKFAIVNFSDRINVNTIYENALSELYQYADYHEYEFIYNYKNYDKKREIYYMKLHVVNEAIIQGLKTKAYDWIFWVDSDIMIANPNIKLENFIPEDERIHFIAAADRHGLNAGVFLIKVHPWSLNFMMRSLAYKYYHKGKHLEYEDQTSMNNILVLDENERNHYVIVPQSWFNTFPDKRHGGELLLHFAGRKDKNKDSNETRTELNNDPHYLTAQTNRKMRKEALEYFAKPRKEQGQLVYVEYYTVLQQIFNFVKKLFHI